MKRKRTEKLKAYARGWYKRNSARVRATSNAQRKERRKDPAYRQYEYQRNRLGKFGLTREQLVVLWTAQFAECAICTVPLETEFSGHIDHDHKTGRVRGLLCNNCNAGLGFFADSCGNLARAMAYLRQARNFR